MLVGHENMKKLYQGRLIFNLINIGDHFAVLIHGEKADDFRRGERTREEIIDLMAGGEAMAELEKEIENLTNGSR
jgi:simple sugar transport system ATP-binding protein